MYRMSDHVFRISSLFLCFPAKLKYEIELLSLHGMHVVKVHIYFLFKRLLYVVVRLKNKSRHVLSDLIPAMGAPPRDNQPGKPLFGNEEQEIYTIYGVVVVILVIVVCFCLI